MKTEPSTYSWADLVRDGRTVWDGVANAAALINLRAMQVGDEVLIYHSGTDKAVIGIGRIVRAAFADPKLNDPRRVAVEVAAVRALKKPVPLAAIKGEPALVSLALVRISRLSVSPVSAEHRRLLRALGVR